MNFGTIYFKVYITSFLFENVWLFPYKITRFFFTYFYDFVLVHTYFSFILLCRTYWWKWQLFVMFRVICNVVVFENNSVPFPCERRVSLNIWHVPTSVLYLLGQMLLNVSSENANSCHSQLSAFRHRIHFKAYL